jgi:outer membrane immunogenic protein
MKHLWLGTIAFAALIGEAQAADIPVTKAPPAAPLVAPVVNWSGIYIGGNVGFAASRLLYSVGIPDGECPPPDPSVSCEDFRFTPISFIGGGQLGIQQQYGSVVFGVEGTWSGTDLHRTDESVLFPGSFRSIKINEIATATFRFGGVWEQALIYAKGGFATARIGVHLLEGPNSPVVPDLTGDVTRWKGGYNLGAGIEYMPWPNLVLGVEFDFYNLQFDTKFPVHFSNGVDTFQIWGSNADIYSVTARLSYLFNWGKAPAAVVAKY